MPDFSSHDMREEVSLLGAQHSVCPTFVFWVKLCSASQSATDFKRTPPCYTRTNKLRHHTPRPPARPHGPQGVATSITPTVHLRAVILNEKLSRASKLIIPTPPARRRVTFTT